MNDEIIESIIDPFKCYKVTVCIIVVDRSGFQRSPCKKMVVVVLVWCMKVKSCFVATISASNRIV